MSLRVQRGLLVVDRHGAAPLADRNGGGASRIRRASTGKFTIGCRGQIGHITQTQAPPCWPYTKPTCRNVKEDVNREKEEKGNRSEFTRIHQCNTTKRWISQPLVLKDVGNKRLFIRKRTLSQWCVNWTCSFGLNPVTAYVSCMIWASLEFGGVKVVELHQRNLQNWTGHCLFSSSQLQSEGWQEANNHSPFLLHEPLKHQNKQTHPHTQFNYCFILFCLCLLCFLFN